MPFLNAMTRHIIMRVVLTDEGRKTSVSENKLRADAWMIYRDKIVHPFTIFHFLSIEDVFCASYPDDCYGDPEIERPWAHDAHQNWLSDFTFQLLQLWEDRNPQYCFDVTLEMLEAARKAIRGGESVPDFQFPFFDYEQRPTQQAQNQRRKIIAPILPGFITT